MIKDNLLPNNSSDDILHKAVYVGNNPVLFVDPSGHLKICLGKIFSGGVSVFFGGLATAAGMAALTIATGGAALIPAIIAGGTAASGAGLVAFGSLEIREGITGHNEVRDFLGDKLYYGGYALAGIGSVVGTSYCSMYSAVRATY